MALVGDPAPGVLVAAAAAAGLAVVGAADDIRPLPALPRLVLQFAAVSAVVVGMDGRILPDGLPLWVERGLLVLAGLWFVNLVNFMDGLDWITVAEMVPITAFLALLGLGGRPASRRRGSSRRRFAARSSASPRSTSPSRGSSSATSARCRSASSSAGCCSSSPATGALAAALLLPLYHLADATITLLRRLARGERVWEAHRSHFYQQATDNGFSPLAVSLQRLLPQSRPWRPWRRRRSLWPRPAFRCRRSRRGLADSSASCSGGSRGLDRFPPDPGRSR